MNIHSTHEPHMRLGHLLKLYMGNSSTYFSFSLASDFVHISLVFNVWWFCGSNQRWISSKTLIFCYHKYMCMNKKSPIQLGATKSGPSPSSLDWIWLCFLGPQLISGLFRPNSYMGWAQTCTLWNSWSNPKYLMQRLSTGVGFVLGPRTKDTSLNIRRNILNDLSLV